jgi:hypothetical protein
MIYLAILFISLGIGCFVYAYYSSNPREFGSNTYTKKPMTEIKKNSFTTSKNYNNSTRNHLKNQTNSTNLESKVLNFKYPNKEMPIDLDKKFKEDREIRSKKSKDNLNANTETVPEINTEEIIEEEPTITQLESEPISPITKITVEDLKDDKEFPKVKSNTEQVTSNQKSSNLNLELEKNKIPPFQINGILYLDFSKKLPFYDRHIKNLNWSEENFLHLKRIGKVKMIEYDGNIQFHSDGHVHEFLLEELDQIVFYDRAFSLMPENYSVPSSLFFSDDASKFKNQIALKMNQSSI